MENSQDLNQALIQTILLWLRQEHNVVKDGYPTWKRLVQAVKEINPALARTIALNHGVVTGMFTIITNTDAISGVELNVALPLVMHHSAYSMYNASTLAAPAHNYVI